MCQDLPVFQREGSQPEPICKLIRSQTLSQQVGKYVVKPLHRETGKWVFLPIPSELSQGVYLYWDCRRVPLNHLKTAYLFIIVLWDFSIQPISCQSQGRYGTSLGQQLQKLGQ